MASSKEYLEFILDQLSLSDGITYKPMMGEYLLYCRGKLFGGVYDDRFLIKQTASVKKRMPEAPLALPYEGAKPMILVEDVDNRELLKTLLDDMVNELPAPKKR